MAHQRVLCIPRSCVEEAAPDQFTPWESAGLLLKAATSQMTWMPRPEAETSLDYMQPIPCALVFEKPEGYFVFRRVKEGRSDLRNRISLVVGGHIDWEAEERDFSELVSSTLRREIAEELGTERITSITPIGLALDKRSVESSRHIAIVHEVSVEHTVRPIATEEFSTSSRYVGRLLSASQLRKRRWDMDPWSSIVFTDYVAPSYLNSGRQLRLL